MAELEQIDNKNTRQLKYPSKKNEEYKYCDIDKLYTSDYSIDSETDQLSNELIGQLNEAKLNIDEKSNLLIYVNGKYNRELSIIIPTQGLSIHNVKKESDNILFQNYFDKCVDQNEILVSNNAQHINEVLFINVAKKSEIETPIIIAYLNTGVKKTCYHTRTLIVAERQSKLNFVELFLGDGEGSKFQNNVTEIAIEDNAKVNHVKIQNAGDNDIVLNTAQALQHKCSKYKSFVISLKGQLIRNLFDSSGFISL